MDGDVIYRLGLGSDFGLGSCPNGHDGDVFVDGKNPYTLVCEMCDTERYLNLEEANRVYGLFMKAYEAALEKWRRHEWMTLDELSLIDPAAAAAMKADAMEEFSAAD